MPVMPVLGGGKTKTKNNHSSVLLKTYIGNAFTFRNISLQDQYLLKKEVHPT